MLIDLIFHFLNFFGGNLNNQNAPNFFAFFSNSRFDNVEYLEISLNNSTNCTYKRKFFTTYFVKKKFIQHYFMCSFYNLLQMSSIFPFIKTI